MGLTHDDVRKILEIIDAAHFQEIRFELGDLRLTASKGGAALPADVGRGGDAALVLPPTVGATVPAAVTAEVSTPARQVPGPHAAGLGTEPVSDGLFVVRSPMFGTFYRAPSSGARPFVEVEDEVKADDTVCLLEVMKLFHSVPAGAEGRVARILAEDGATVEYGQPIILIEPGS